MEELKLKKTSPNGNWTSGLIFSGMPIVAGIYGLLNNWGLLAIALIVLGLASTAFFFFMTIRHKRNQEEFMSSAQPITTTVIGLDRLQIGSNSEGRTVFVLLCEWIHPMTGQRIVFRSENLTGTAQATINKMAARSAGPGMPRQPGVILEATVYVDPTNYTKYVVDTDTVRPSQQMGNPPMPGQLQQDPYPTPEVNPAQWPAYGTNQAPIWSQDLR